MSNILESTPSDSGEQNLTAAASTVEVPSYRPRQTFGQLLRNDLGFLPVLLTLIIVVAFFSIVSNGLFLHPENFSDLISQIATFGSLGLGAVLVLLLGEVDLSAASVAYLSAAIMATLAERIGMPGWLAILSGLATGALLGAINGFFVSVLRIPSFIVTLAASIGYAGLLTSIVGTQTAIGIQDPLIIGIAGTSKSFLPDVPGIALPTAAVLIYIASLFYNYITRRRAGLRTVSLTRLIIQSVLVLAIVEGAVILFENYLGVPYSTAILFALILIVWIMLTKTRFGRHIYATGGNAEAARRAGIPVVSIRIIVFALAGMLAAVGGILLASRGLGVQSQISSTLLLDVIGAAVIGGVSLFGGRGSAWAIVLGALIIGSLDNGLALLNKGTDVKEMIEGVVLILAVTADALIRRAQARSSSGR